MASSVILSALLTVKPNPAAILSKPLASFFVLLLNYDLQLPFS